MAKILLFYAASIIGTACTVEELKEGREQLAKHTGLSVLLRDVAVFDAGDLEHSEKEPVERVLCAGPDDAFDGVRQAYEALGISVDIGGPFLATSESETESDEELAARLKLEQEMANDPLASLKAEATALGLNFASNIGEAVLRQRVDKAKADKAADEKAAADKVAEGDGGGS